MAAPQKPRHESLINLPSTLVNVNINLEISKTHLDTTPERVPANIQLRARLPLWPVAVPPPVTHSSRLSSPRPQEHHDSYHSQEVVGSNVPFHARVCVVKCGRLVPGRPKATQPAAPLAVSRHTAAGCPALLGRKGGRARTGVASLHSRFDLTITVCIVLRLLGLEGRRVIGVIWGGIFSQL